MASIFLSILCLIAVSLTSGCGYRFGSSALSKTYGSISVPYVEGDQNGELTSEIVKQLSSLGSFDYKQEGGNLIVKVKIVEFRDSNIGFRYDRNNQGQFLPSIIPAETRAIIIAEVQVIEAISGRCVLGPARISAYIDFDHEYYSSPNEINVFSLGQLSDSYEAHDAVYHPLNLALAQKIVDYINNSW